MSCKACQTSVYVTKQRVVESVHQQLQLETNLVSEAMKKGCKLAAPVLI
ncbi:hypothetical protein MUN89_14815 [Halobacillus salinarum]|uniref:Uncharacterized protein n=1 Tax=Halobacillus salinarum TaxID=2932257 RepID=A0ABY4EFF9_9BACI|nr:hypothetical protein [Halobacillus salinarum]UOQ43200.1 hypothetical protein MUN89_14815 [Halobacillus salinarum]